MRIRLEKFIIAANRNVPIMISSIGMRDIRSIAKIVRHVVAAWYVLHSSIYIIFNL